MAVLLLHEHRLWSDTPAEAKAACPDLQLPPIKYVSREYIKLHVLKNISPSLVFTSTEQMHFNSTGVGSTGVSEHRRYIASV